ncbi:MAG: SIR2 family protein, partial [candidate division KSB1 bacterium]
GVAVVGSHLLFKSGVDGKELAKEILTDLNCGVTPTFETSLVDACEFYIAVNASTRNGLETLIQNRLSGLQPTLGHYLATTFSWRAVVTTNYNTVLEDTWRKAEAQGFQACDLLPIRTDRELLQEETYQGQIRLYKPHGCITLAASHHAPMVLTSEDYFNSKQSRAKIFEAIKELAQEHITLFVGYSLNDFTFRNLFYDLYSELGKSAKRLFSVLPDNDELRFEWDAIAKQKFFNTTLINDYFDTFMLRLVKVNGKLHRILKLEIQQAWPTLEQLYPHSMSMLEIEDFMSL